MQCNSACENAETKTWETSQDVLSSLKLLLQKDADLL